MPNVSAKKLKKLMNILIFFYLKLLQIFLEVGKKLGRGYQKT
jgi:hypothetical protein